MTNKIYMSFETLDEIYDNVASLKQYDSKYYSENKNDLFFKAEKWIPDLDKIKPIIEKNIAKYIKFMIWFVETNEGLPDQKPIVNYFNKLMRDNMELIDSEEEYVTD